MQSAIFEATGHLDALVLYRAKGGFLASELRMRASHLMAALDTRQQGVLTNRPSNLHVLVAVSSDLLTDGQRAEASAGLDAVFAGSASTATQALLPPAHGSKMRLGDGPALICVQISAPTLAERLYALRLTRTFLNRAGDLEGRILEGGRLAQHWEPFGYPDGRPTITAGGAPGSTTLADLDALESTRVGAVATKLGLDPEAPAEKPLWLLHQRYEHDFDSFFALSQLDRDRVMGVDRYGDPVAGGHAALSASASWAQSMARRGFAYHADEVEGLAFQALSGNPSSFRDALAEMVASHALLDHATAAETGLFIVPPSASWLAEQPVAAPEVPAACRAMLRGANGPIPAMTIQEVCPQMVRYLELARANGLFGVDGMDMPSQTRALILALEQLLAGATVTTQVQAGANQNDQVASDLELTRDRAQTCSTAINEAAGRYVTLSG